MIPDPYVIAQDGPLLIVLAKADALAGNKLALSQTYDRTTQVWSEITPLQQVLKFLYGVEPVDPPQPLAEFLQQR